ncbi:Myo-inositol-1-phosphate synthase [Photorhabdus luminescens subsp. luminescens]|uniref:Myo-inositol-1-phosphate synthase n=1 Tax=Photorhabdus luminescens TaxID=29488 RepID=A0A1G5PPM1_PHOLU|nr:myo-inositol-1-phosphate synthase [Photorhabdus luminescens]KMW74589.1 Myo-inositol-1-phosphate synthase [Photorhabdus luminescens subsp. luminescens]SCZ51402.1 myo-inositol-1-phosphate synthase [Photorhabdus luminescens]
MINVAIAGIGNCCSSLYQGIYFHLDSDPIINDLGISIKDINVKAAYDVDCRKVGLPISKAIFAKPNCARVFCTDLPEGPIVEKIEVFDGVSLYMSNQPEDRGFRVSSDQKPINLVSSLKENEIDILINYLPVGSQKATEYLAECCLESGVSLLNCIPVFIASDPEWDKKFYDKGIPIIGDDMKSHLGASILSQVYQELAHSRNLAVDYHQQINIGGNTDFNNMMVQDRLTSKKISKENVIRSQNEIAGVNVLEDSIFAGPSTYIPYLKDNKVAHIRLELTGFGGSKVEIDTKLSVQDSENSAGVVIDAIRYLKIARNMGLKGALKGPSAWTQKTPPVQLKIEEAISECQKLAAFEVPKHML